MQVTNVAHSKIVFKVNLPNLEIVVIPQFSMLEPQESKMIKFFFSALTVQSPTILIEVEAVVFNTSFMEILVDPV